MNYQLPTLASHQRGDGIGGFVAMVIVFVMTLKLGVAIVPAQWNDRQLDSAIAKELQKTNSKKGSEKQLVEAIKRQLQLNAMYDVKVEEMYTFTGGKGNLVAHKKYQVESNFLPGVFITNKFEGEIRASDAE